ncbi:hypothetical protein LBMAG56_45150 [Verrucomicrobiota bacterium]|nr:hypothetical protein LBMAG56_45150 [Verrucomicrobiota bacterium]
MLLAVWCVVAFTAAAAGAPTAATAQAATAATKPAEAITEIFIDPLKITVDSPGGRFRVLVSGKTAAGRVIDLTHTAEFRSLDAALFQVSARGELQTLRDGRGTLEVRAAGQTARAVVEVRPAEGVRLYSFENDITPMLNRAG